MSSETSTFDRASEPEIREAVEDAGTTLDVQRHLRLNRTQTRRLLRELNVLGDVETTDPGRSTANADRERRVRGAVEAPQSGERQHCIDCDTLDGAIPRQVKGESFLPCPSCADRRRGIGPQSRASEPPEGPR